MIWSKYQSTLASYFLPQIRISLLLILINGVVDREDVLGIKSLFDAFVKFVVQRAHSLVHESLSQLADTVVMGDTATILENSGARQVFDVFIDIDGLVFRVLVIQQ